MNTYAEQYVFTDELKNMVNSAAAGVIGAEDVQGAVEEADFGALRRHGSYADSLAEEGFDISELVDEALESSDVPDTSAYGVWVPSIRFC